MSLSKSTDRSKTMASSAVGLRSSPTGTLAWVGFGCCAAALTCLLVSYCSPYWLQSLPMAENRFMNIGLWQVCLYNYKQFRDDSMQDVYDGCWSVLDDATRYFKLREWLTPPSFVSCQVLVTASLIFELTSAVVTGVCFLHFCPSTHHEYLQTYGILASGSMMLLGTFISVIVAIIFGVQSNDRYWLPRPDQNYLSWGFAFLIISGIFALASGILFLLEGRRTYRNLFRTEDVFRQATREAFAVPYEHEPSSDVHIYDKEDRRREYSAVAVSGSKVKPEESRTRPKRSEGRVGSRREDSSSSGFGDLGQVSVSELEGLSRTMERCSSTVSEVSTDNQIDLRSPQHIRPAGNYTVQKS